MSAVLALLALLCGPALAGEDKAFSRELQALTTGFHGTVGVYARQLKTGRWAAVGADEEFPTASLIKIPILIGLFDKLDKGELDYNSPLVYSSTRAYSSGDLLAAFKDSETISTAKLVSLMESYSDNTAALWCQELAGGGAAINSWLSGHGFLHTRVNARTDGREEQHKKFGWGQTTPKEMAELLVMIREGKAVSPAADAEMFRVLSRTYLDQESLSQIPPSAHVASKQGAVERSRSEVLLVSFSKGDYVLSVITKNQADARWDRDNEGYELLRRASSLAWRRFGSKQPALVAPPGAEKYWKKD